MAAPAYLIFDTGAAFSSLSRHLAVPFGEPPEFEVSGPGSGLATAFRAGPLQLRIAGRDLSDSNVITLDFSRLSNAHGIKISGLIGYPMLGVDILDTCNSSR